MLDAKDIHLASLKAENARLDERVQVCLLILVCIFPTSLNAQVNSIVFSRPLPHTLLCLLAFLKWKRLTLVHCCIFHPSPPSLSNLIVSSILPRTERSAQAHAVFKRDLAAWQSTADDARAAQRRAESAAQDLVALSARAEQTTRTEVCVQCQTSVHC